MIKAAQLAIGIISTSGASFSSQQSNIPVTGNESDEILIE